MGWYILAIIVTTVGIILYEVPDLIKKGLKRDLIVFSILLTIGVILSIAEALNVILPNPLDLLTIIYRPISELIFNVLK